MHKPKAIGYIHVPCFSHHCHHPRFLCLSAVCPFLSREPFAARAVQKHWWYAWQERELSQGAGTGRRSDEL